VTRLSEHFELREFLRSEIAARVGRCIEPSDEITANLARLCELVLEPIRAELGGAITVLSGYRPLWLNQMAQGSLTSEHMYGRAADIEIAGMLDEEACNRIALMLPRLPVNQLILEYPPSGWVHVSVCEAHLEPRREILTAVRRNRQTVYMRGIVPQRAA